MADHNIITYFMKIWTFICNGVYWFTAASKDTIPGPLAFPIIGTTWTQYFKSSDADDDYLKNTRDRYDSWGPIVKEEFYFRFPIIHCYDSKDIEKVLSQSSMYPLRPPTRVIQNYRLQRPDRYSSAGLVNVQGEEWRLLRDSLTPAITSPKIISSYFPMVNRVTEDFISLLDNSRDSNGAVTDFRELAYRFGLENMCGLVLGRRMGFLEDNVPESIKELVEVPGLTWAAAHQDMFGSSFSKFFPNEIHARFVSSQDLFYEVVGKIVDEAIQEDVEGRFNESSDEVRIFASILRAKNIDIKEKKTAIIDFIMAGIDTVSHTLTFALYHLATNHDVQNKLYREIESMIPGIGCNVTAESIGNMPYLRACLNESTRLLPVAPSLARILDTDLKLQNYDVPAGTFILCQTWFNCLQESNYEHALEFIPDRWLTNEQNTYKKPSAFTSVPFGCGRRQCPGRRFAEQEIQVILTKIIQKYEVEMDRGFEVYFRFLQTPRPPVRIVLKERNL